MLNEILFDYKVLNIPGWFWLIIIIYFLYTMYNKCTINTEIKEKFNNSKVKVYNFNTEWCGWSKRFQPEWEKFTELCNKMTNVTAIDVKCDNEENKELCKKFEVPGFPTVIFEVGDKIIPYNKERTATALVEFIKTI